MTRATPHEQAFQRWSIPDVEGRAPGNQSFALAPTVRVDSPVPAAPSSFRVYTPAEMKVAPMSTRRRAMNDATVLTRPEESLTPLVLLKWTGMGVAAGFAVLATLFLFLSLGDDVQHVATKSTRAAIGQNLDAPVPPPPAPKPLPAVQAAPAEPVIAAAPPPVTPKPKKKKSKKPAPPAL